MIPADDDLTEIQSKDVARIAAYSEVGLDLGQQISPTRRIGKYAILKLIGSGGHGYVYLAHDTEINRFVALKIPRSEVLESNDLKRRFTREALAATKINHRNVVRIIDSGEIDTYCYIAMEYCAEGSLSDWLKKRQSTEPLSARWVATLIAEIADGVHQAHLCRPYPILHRDLKPGNILLVRTSDYDDPEVPSFVPKVCDFGLAKHLGEGAERSGLTPSDARVGTLPYMSPEQAIAKGAIGPRADVYSLGVILFELLTGQRPFQAKAEADLLPQVTSKAVARSPRTLRSDVPISMATICRSCLAKSPSDRYATAAELADDLRRFLRNEEVKGVPWWKRARASGRRHTNRAGMAAVALLILGVGLATPREGDRSEQAQATEWVDLIKNASLNDLSERLAKREHIDSAVLPELRLIFQKNETTPRERLNVAIALAGVSHEYSNYVYKQLIAAKDEEIQSIAVLLDQRIQGLAQRLNEDIATADRTPDGAPSDPESIDRRKAQAATALMLIGDVQSSIRNLEFDPKPVVRSLLIHKFGPARVSPTTIYQQILNQSVSVEARRALILALGEVSATWWTDRLRAQVTETLWTLYRDDPDAGIHGSAKWLLRLWKMDDTLEETDLELMKLGQRQGFQWRIHPSGLTFVRWTDPITHRVLEISDCEITRKLFLRFHPKHPYRLAFSPTDDCPITNTSFVDAAEFCGWIDGWEETPPDQRCYEEVEPGLFEPVEGSHDRTGFRLLTDDEFERVTAAGTTSQRHCGDLPELLPKYAWYMPVSSLKTHPVGRLKPNDVGLFDTLGNANDLCEATGEVARRKMRATFLGGSFFHNYQHVHSRLNKYSSGSVERSVSEMVGFRIARTVQPSLGN